MNGHASVELAVTVSMATEEYKKALDDLCASVKAWGTFTTPSEEELRAVSKKDIVRVLRHAIVILEAEGWIKGTSHNENGYCVLGALGQATDRTGLSDAVCTRAVRLLDLLVDRQYSYDSVIYFNDAEHTSYEDVILVMKQAIAELDM